VLWDVPPQ
jgi:hypothetical protein